jgi:hypothetical protein
MGHYTESSRSERDSSNRESKGDNIWHSYIFLGRIAWHVLQTNADFARRFCPGWLFLVASGFVSRLSENLA